jgi:hypothetical protein
MPYHSSFRNDLAVAQKTTRCEAGQQFGIDEANRDVAIPLRKAFQFDLEGSEVRVLHVEVTVALAG